MATDGDVPALGFGAGAIKYVVTFGFNIGELIITTRYGPTPRSGYGVILPSPKAGYALKVPTPHAGSTADRSQRPPAGT